MGFATIASKACDARSLSDCAVLTTPFHPRKRQLEDLSILPPDNLNVKNNSIGDSSNAVLMPWVGYGTYRLGQRHSRSATFQALQVGYRHIDTAFIYGGQTTEIEVGKALQDAFDHKLLNNREDVFVTTKQWREFHGYQKSLSCLEQSLQRLGLDYVDCWMMHWPGPCWNKSKTRHNQNDREENDPWINAAEGMGKEDMASLRAETWRAMEDALRQGKTRAIAVSNFNVQHLETLKRTATLWPPALNQVECHPYYPQNDLRAYCQKEGIILQAYAALGGQDGTKAQWKKLGGKFLEAAPVLAASKRLSHGNVSNSNMDNSDGATGEGDAVTPGQILLRWALQRNCAIVPKTSSPARMRENANIFDFSLEDEEMEQIARLVENIDDKDAGRLCWRTDPLRLLDFP